MKTLKLLFYSLVFTLVTVYSCTNSDSFIDDLADPQESATMQSVLNELITLYNEDGTGIDGLHPTDNLIFDFCFEFVYPIVLIYNNGSTVIINNLEELIEVLINSTNDLFIVGIEFPFDVAVYNSDTNEIEIITINNENEFAALLNSCDFNDCDCSNDYDPVCVEVEENGTIIIITFTNACFAVCEGFTEKDFVDCPIDGCEIVSLEVLVGDCNPDGTYSISINFEYTNAGNDFFDVFVRDNELIGTYSLSELPLTINEFELSGFDFDYVKVCINDNPDCCEEIEWEAPNCVINTCDIFNLEVIVGDCNPDTTYSLTINFDYENPGNDFFDVFVRDNEFIGFYSLSELPVTIENFELSGFDFDFVKVCINDNSDCCDEIEWVSPDCN